MLISLHLKVRVQPPENAPTAATLGGAQPPRMGIRADNIDYMVYQQDKLPQRSAADFDSTLWLDKPYHLMYCWPLFAPCSFP